MNIIQTKTCTKCNTSKPYTLFRKQSATRDGYKNVCKDCDDATARARYLAKRESIIKQNLEWQKKNKDKVKIYSKRYKEKKKSETKNV